MNLTQDQIQLKHMGWRGRVCIVNAFGSASILLSTRYRIKKKSETVRLSGMGRADVGMSSFPLKKEELESFGSDNIARVL